VKAGRGNNQRNCEKREPLSAPRRAKHSEERGQRDSKRRVGVRQQFKTKASYLGRAKKRPVEEPEKKSEGSRRKLRRLGGKTLPGKVGIMKRGQSLA